MVSKGRARRLKRLHDKHKEDRLQLDIFLQGVSYIRGEATGPHPDSDRFEGTVFGAWTAADGGDPRGVPDFSK